MSISTRYARALWESAKERPVAEQRQVYEKMILLRGCLLSMPELREALENPTTTNETKRELLLTAGGANNSPLYESFVNLVLSHRRANKLIWIVPVYTDMYRRAQGIVSVTVESAAPISDETREKIVMQLNTMLKSEVECHYKVLPELIGGFRLRIGDKRIDASYKRKLEDIRRELMEN
ncbi:MAG: ATP synthase F1 subunit delta [Bacteroidaceae bacterium]|nr:ATP synthase F1 subunit delta [Bacteroidaceae bacterium]